MNLIISIVIHLAWKGAFGLETLKHRHKIPDVLFTASSSVDYDHVASKARLYGENAWCPSQANGSFIQIVFLKSIQLFGIAIQGDPDSSKWITKYDFQYGNFIDELTTIPVSMLLLFDDDNDNGFNDDDDDDALMNWLIPMSKLLMLIMMMVEMVMMIFYDDDDDDVLMNWLIPVS